MPTESREGRSEDSRAEWSSTGRQASPRSSLTRNAAINLIGQIAPLGVGLFAIPVIIDGIGIERFGVLNIAWMVVGYFNMFDIGLGRAITKFVAEFIAMKREHELGHLIGSGVGAMIVFGGLGGALAWMLSSHIVQQMLNIPDGMIEETVGSFKLLAISVPIVVVSIGLRGVLQAQQRFGAVNTVRVPVALNTFLGPMFISYFTSDLRYIVGGLVAGRCLGMVGNAILVIKSMPSNTAWRVRKSLVKTLVGTGGWITVSNVISPVLVYADRFIIGGTMTMSAVAYYSTPFEVVTKVLLIPASITAVLFPAFSAGHAARKSGNATLYWKGLGQIHFLVFPVLAFGAVFSSDILEAWLGLNFAVNGALPLSILCFGVWINSLGSVPFALIQGTGGARTTATLHAIEAPAYLLALIFMASRYGLWGAAATWSFRVSVDAVVLHLIALKRMGSSSLNPTISSIALAAGVLLIMMFQPNLSLKAIMYLTVLTAHVVVNRLLLRTALRSLFPGSRAGTESNP